MQPYTGDNEDMVFTQQTSETALSIWLSENALSHCAQFLTAEGWTSPLDFRELRGKDVATIRECGVMRSALKTHPRAGTCTRVKGVPVVGGQMARC